MVVPFCEPLMNWTVSGGSRSNWISVHQILDKGVKPRDKHSEALNHFSLHETLTRFSGTQFRNPLKTHFKMSAISSIFTLTSQTNPVVLQTRGLKQTACSKLVASPSMVKPISLRRFRACVVAEGVSATADVAARRVYVGNIPRTVNNDELKRIVEEHGAVEKVEVMMIMRIDFFVLVLSFRLH